MSVKVSVIIPVYNCEKYIRECIESLINQTLKECEFIFVNDGSIDKSKEIIEEYASKDIRIKLINQKNGGVSVARNTGLENAVGEYIGFVDGDDYIDIDYYENLYNTAVKNSCDIVMCDWKSQTNYLSLPFEKDRILNKKYIEENIYPYFIQYEGMNSVWNKIFRTRLIKQNKIEFPKGVKLGEDAIFNIKAFTYLNNCFYLSYSGYFYREVEGSATKDIIKNDYFKAALNTYKNIPDEYKDWAIKPEEIERLKAIKFLNTVISLTYIYFVPNKNNTLKDRYKYVKDMIKNEQVLLLFNRYYKDISINRGRYERKLIENIKKTNILNIYLLTLYSRLRNRNRYICNQNWGIGIMKKYLVMMYSNINIFIRNFKSSAAKIFVKPPKVKLIDETIEEILRDNCSVSRFGDGELWLICGGSIRYQKSDNRLRERLKEVLISNSDNHIVTIPDVFTVERLNLRTDENVEFWKEHLRKHRSDWYANLDLKKQYYNTAISRFYIPIKNKKDSERYIGLLKQIWDKKDIVIVEGSGSRLGVGNDLFNNATSIERLICPAENAFDKYSEIINEAKRLDRKKLILIALGPTATVLAYDLYKLGYWAIDIGHIDLEYEWFKLGVKKQIKIENKYTNEVNDGADILECRDLKYNNEIICRID